MLSNLLVDQLRKDKSVMDYQKIYNQLIQKRLTDSLSKKDCYCETHHIIPLSEGGSDTKDNKVNLSAREHYIAHLLLAKIYDDFKMYSAITYMQTGRHKDRNFKYNNRLFGKMREEFGKKSSERMKGRFVGEKSPMYGKHLSEETKRKLSEAKRGQQSWMKGKHHTAEAKAKISAVRKGKKLKPLSDDHKKAISEGNKGRKCANKGKRWVNDSIKNSYILIGEELPPGFVWGRIKFKHKKKRKNKNSGN